MMHTFSYTVELINGFRKTMEEETTNEVEFTISAKNRVTADRMVSAILGDNVKSVIGICED